MKDAITRKDRIYNAISELTRSIDFDDFSSLQIMGLDAEHIGNNAGVSRANTSKELNRLVKEGKVLKIKGKPVIYLDSFILSSKHKSSFNSVYSGITEFSKYLGMLKQPDIKENEGQYNKTKQSTTEKKQENSRVLLQGNFQLKQTSDKGNDVFSKLIGSDKSLKVQVGLAKAAILYPPNGIHTLIVGPTGVGKSTFAEVMYKFAIESGRIAEKSPFVTFNCADYCDNPQLLMSQLFGHTKGAFTGADKEKAGLIDNANGGILFLDEVHRLPPEGQEMLFYMIDKGAYRRLGETDSNRHARVLIIAATTEEPKSSMLHTFLRRIPAVIELPALGKRTIDERIKLISQFFWEESSRINAPIKVSKEVLRALMFYDCPGNIGQLRSDIKLICAKAFLNYISLKTDSVKVELSHISQTVQEGLFKVRDKRYNYNNNIYENEDVTFDSANEKFKEFILEPVDKIQYGNNYYDCIIDNWNRYSQMGLSEEETRSKVENELEEYYRSFFASTKYKPSTIKNENLRSIVGADILEAVEYALNSVRDILGDSINERVICGLALHIKNLIQRLNTGNIIVSHYKENVARKHSYEFNAAERIKLVIEDRLGINVPDGEVVFIAMMLYAIKTTKYRESVGILVIAHGKSTASSMAEVANALLDVDCIKGIDMPLDVDIDSVLNRTIEEVKCMDKGKGVLILVDMGSLTDFSRIITEKTGIKTSCIDMVSTLIVLEAARKAIMMDIDLQTLTAEVKSSISLANSKDESILPVNMEDSFRSKIVDALGDALTFLDSRKTFDALSDILKTIAERYNQKIQNDILIKFVFHCSYMIERVIKNEPLPYKKMEKIKNENGEAFADLRHTFEIIEETFDISIPDSELAYVFEMVTTYFGKTQ